MSPSLSREHYFLTVLNQLAGHDVVAGSLEHELREVLLELAATVSEQREWSGELLTRINDLFVRYPAVRLQISLRPALVADAVSMDSTTTESSAAFDSRLLLHTAFVDGPDRLRRMYMEALISLLEAVEQKPLDLKNCTECNHWYMPYARAKVTRFCSAKCRNHYHYRMRKQEKEEQVL
jgi:hypothetical protein